MILKHEDCIDPTRRVNSYRIYHEDYNCLPVYVIVKHVDAILALFRPRLSFVCYVRFGIKPVGTLQL